MQLHLRLALTFALDADVMLLLAAANQHSVSMEGKWETAAQQQAYFCFRHLQWHSQ